MSFLNHLISGISLGSIYAIIALGYTMVYGIAKMLNFAHGDVIMVGGYMCFCATTYLGWPAWMGVVLAVIVCTALGVVIERLAYKPLRMAPSLAVLITAIGVSYFLQNAALLIWSSNPKTFTSVVTGEALSLFGGQMQISKVTLVAIAACVVIMVALMLFTGKSKVGTAMRAVSEDKGAAQLMGINVNTTISITFAIGSGLAAIAGVLLCSAYPTLMLLTPFNADATDEKTASFVKKYKEQFGETPNQFAADAYDCVYAYKQALENAGATPDMSAEDLCDKMIEQFTSMTFDGLTGEGMTWDETGAVSKSPKGMVIKNGAYVGM